ADRVVGDVLEAQLDAGDVASIQRRCQEIAKISGLKGSGRDAVEPALSRLVLRHRLALAEIDVDDLIEQRERLGAGALK
ncbi:hypothetical protein ABTE14_20850, partial [Acinetobacter baumannii]